MSRESEESFNFFFFAPSTSSSILKQSDSFHSHNLHNVQHSVVSCEYFGVVIVVCSQCEHSRVALLYNFQGKSCVHFPLEP